jgi:hypothetical protein
MWVFDFFKNKQSRKNLSWEVLEISERMDFLGKKMQWLIDHVRWTPELMKEFEDRYVIRNQKF